MPSEYAHGDGSDESLYEISSHMLENVQCYGFQSPLSIYKQECMLHILLLICASERLCDWMSYMYHVIHTHYYISNLI